MKTTRLLVAMVLLSVIEADLYLASFPSIAAYFQVSESAIQGSLSVYFLVFSIWGLLLGPISQRWGAKRVFLGALFLDLVGTMSILGLPYVSAFWIGRGLQAIGGAGGAILSRVLVRELFLEEEHATVLGYLFMGIAAALGITPLLGGVIEEWVGWKGNFFALFLFQITLFWSISKGIASTPSGQQVLVQHKKGWLCHVQLGMRQYKDIAKSPRFIWFGGLVALAWSSTYLFIGGSSFFMMEVLRISPLQYGVLFAGLMGVMMLGHFFSAIGEKRYGIQKILWIGIGILGMSMVGFFCFFSSVFAVWAVTALYLFGVGLLLPLSQNEATKGAVTQAAPVLSLFIFFQTFSASLVGGGFAFFFSFRDLLWCMGIMAGLTAGWIVRCSLRFREMQRVDLDV